MPISTLFHQPAIGFLIYIVLVRSYRVSIHISDFKVQVWTRRSPCINEALLTFPYIESFFMLHMLCADYFFELMSFVAAISLWCLPLYDSAGLFANFFT